MLVNGGIHAREWQTPEAVTGLIEAMVDGKADGGSRPVPGREPEHGPRAGQQRRRLHADPALPDRTTADRAQPRDGRMRRKNLRNPQTQGAIDADMATVADNFWGIDLNRNSVDGFGQRAAAAGARPASIYRGHAADSEPEIAALQ